MQVAVSISDKTGVSIAAPEAVTTLTAVKPLQTLKVAGVIGGSGDGSNTDLFADKSPQLGADLDVNGFSFTSTNNTDVVFTPNGTGAVSLDGVVKFKRFSTPPEAFEGGMYADENNRLYFGVSDS